jgi:hypothetical protein
MPTRRSHGRNTCFLESGSLEDSMDSLNYKPYLKIFFSRSPTPQTRQELLCRQPDLSDPILRYVVDAYRRCNLQDIDPRNIFLMREFYFWLRDVFIPFLKRLEGIVPTIFVQVDDFLKGLKLPVISQIIKKLRNHFSEVPLCIIRSISLWKWRRNRFFHLMPQPSTTAQFISGFTLANLQRCHTPSTILEEVGLTRNNSLILISKLDYFSSVEGKLLRRRLLGLSIAQNLIKRLSYSQRDMFFLLMRVLGERSFA